MEDRLLRQNEAAEILGIAPASLANMRCFGRGPPYVKRGARVFYRLDEVLAYKEERDARRRRPTA